MALILKAVALVSKVVYSTSDSKFLFEDSTFLWVSIPSGGGGAIYTENGEIVHNRICSFNCSTKGSGQYCYCHSLEGLFKKYVIESTLSKFSEKLIGEAPIYFKNGNTLLTREIFHILSYIQ